MANSYLTVDLVTKEAQRVLHEKATFISTVNREFDDSFKGPPKIGTVLRIRQPNEFEIRTSGNAMNVQDQAEASTSLTLASLWGVDMHFYHDELALDIEDFSTRYIEPAVKKLVSKLDANCLATATKATYNSVGTAGTLPGASGDISAIHNARARLNQMLAPDDDRHLQMDSVTMASVVNGLKGNFTPASAISKAFTEGFYGRAAGLDLHENERTWSMSNGSDVTSNTAADAAVTDGGTNITADNVTITVGQVFTVAGVYAAHPETKESLGYLQQFTNTAGTTGALTVSPATILSGAKQNVCSSTGAALATTDFNSKAMVFVGSASTAYRQSLAYHRDAFAFVTAELPLMGSAEECVRKTQDGISLRVWKGADIVNNRLLMRIDVLWGFGAVRPSLACRITN